ncbi:hypothetical protein A2752_03720 [Candidatus Uhrbacteria bacterium RIFCSPHIGHO2_01_FULL_46_23]|nr:MAG: hypothetical protein A2752_03720 [Candidatus Uhrbacteria bacterium RIFCSPHIGHO2_01_FULL_46_23]
MLKQWLFFLFLFRFSLFRIFPKKAYFLSVSHPAALGAAATIRNRERVYDETRTFFKLTYGNSNIKPTEAVNCDSSPDMAAAGRPALAILPSTMTNVDQSKQEAKLNNDNGVIYRAKPVNPGWFGSPGRR